MVECIRVWLQSRVAKPSSCLHFCIAQEADDVIIQNGGEEAVWLCETSVVMATSNTFIQSIRL